MFEQTFANRRILVTGDTGFKGAWLCHWLLRMGAEVVGMGLEPATSPNLFTILNLQDRMRHYPIDIRDFCSVQRLFSLEKPEFVFHLAAQAIVRESYQTPKETFDVNVGGVVNLLEAIRFADEVQACVVVTSDKCYENREQTRGYHEGDPVGGRDPYSASKGAAEIVSSAYRQSFFQGHDKTRVASARAGNVLGGGDWSQDRIVVDIVNSIQANKPLMLRNPHAIRPWQHVLDPLSGYLTLAEALSRDNGEQVASAWNFGPNLADDITVGQLAKACVDQWGQGRIEYATEAGQPHEATILKLDCSKAMLKLRWRPVWGFSDTVRASVEWYQACHSGHSDMIELTDQQIENYEADALQINDDQSGATDPLNYVQDISPAA